MSAPSSSPIMPLGILDARVSPIENPIGSECRTARPSRAPRAVQASSTRWMSLCATARPPMRDLGVEQLRAEPSAGRVEDDAFDLDAGHALGRVDGEPDRFLGGVHIDDGAALDAARALMPDAEDPAPMRASAQRLGSRRPD